MRILEFFKRKKKKQNIEYVYHEEDTHCDKCEYLESCKEKGIVCEFTKLEDTRPHFAKTNNLELCDDEKEQILSAADDIRAKSGCRFCHGYKYKVVEYCNVIELKKTISETDVKDCQIFLYDNGNPTFMIFDKKGFAAFFEIEFCPMCGRKLVQR
jgi:hypothetical protein